jgi:chemotaxis methyl-accepting protein methylase
LLRTTVRVTRQIAKFCWDLLPDSVLSTPVFLKLGKLIHGAHINWQDRVQGCKWTYFFRNEPLLEALRDLSLKVSPGGTWRVISAGCSTGAELYSVLWYLRSARSDLHISGVGLDIDEAVIAKAGGGRYLPGDYELSLLSTSMLEALFDQASGALQVKEWVRKDIRWLVVDATDPALLNALEPVNLLLANNLIGAMSDEKAEALMENLIRLVSPGGYFVLNGNLDVKTRFAKKHGLVPICDRMEAIHFGDPTKTPWPWYHSSPEPIEPNHPDWPMRYAQVFAKPPDDRAK